MIHHGILYAVQLLNMDLPTLHSPSAWSNLAQPGMSKRGVTGVQYSHASERLIQPD